MNWLKKAKQGIKTWRKKNLPDGLWEKCPSCGEILFRKELEKAYSVCQKCDYHFRIDAERYIGILTDPGSFDELFGNLTSGDPLGFRDSKRYTARVQDARKRTGANSAILTGTARIEGREAAVGVMDFAFLGGSMGSVVGEKIMRLAQAALDRRMPLVILSTSGGARMQESILSLMQMAKTSAATAMLANAGIPYISILTNPTTGGVAASFSFQGDIIIAEPKALIGFAGPRVIRETVGEELPDGFQRSEFLLEHGMIDRICSRRDMKRILSFYIESLDAGLQAEEENRDHDVETIPLLR